MKHNYLILVVLLSFSFTQAQIVDIPDANFKNALVGLNCVDYDGDGDGDGDADVNNDGEIQVAEAEAVLKLILPPVNISSLQGIEAFINLQVLDCDTNLLTTLDVRGLTNLERLYCSYNNLTSINVSGLTNLTRLDITDNELITLDVSGLTNLTYLLCFNNQLTDLNVSGLTNLTSLLCSSNNLTTLDVSGLTNLESLLCNSNQFIALDVSGLVNITNFRCGYNNLTTLDVSGLINLEKLHCYNNNNLTSLFMKNGNEIINDSDLNFSNNPNLEFICVDDFEYNRVLSKVEYYGYSNVVINSYCSFVPGGKFYTISGENKIDSNINGCDVNDTNYPNFKFSITDGTIIGNIISDVSGRYFIPVQAGTHTITPVFENPEYFTVSPASVIVEFLEESSPYIQDFCITPSGTAYSDLEIIIIPLEIARPGFETDYKVLYKSKGNTTLSGTVEFDYNENANLMTLVSSTPNAESNVANVLTWSFTDLLPLEIREILITMDLNTPTDTPPLNGGDDLGFVANIFPLTGDETMSDNNFQLKQAVVNSFDPNDKTCLEGETITPEQVGKFVHYMIRFENTGTASAVNIVVKDEIDQSKYDVSTLIPLDASHDFFTRIKDDNIVEFIFEDINLPFDDANNDGFVVFKIKTLETLVLGDTFSNDAEIYFDYNAPIITNDEETTVAENLSVEESTIQDIVKLYPNPVSNTLFIDSKNTLESIAVFDVHGRQLQHIAIVGNKQNLELNVSTFSVGIYFVKIKTEIGLQTTKIIKN